MARKSHNINSSSYGSIPEFLGVLENGDQDEANQDEALKYNDPKHAQTSKRTRFLLVICVLFMELCERLTFYGVVANLVLYCKDVLKLKSPLPTTINLAFQGTSFFSPVIGGWVADTFLGRYNTIYGSGLLYIVGTCLLAASTFDYGPRYEPSLSSRGTFIGVSLLLISVGTGGIKSNVSPLGADQLKSEGSQVLQRFFDWFYWFIQLGSFLAYTAVVYVQQDVSFFCGYLITASSVLVAMVLFVLGRNHYVLYPPKGSYLTDTCKIIWFGFKKIFCKETPEVNHWLDRAKESSGGEFPDERVEDAKSVTGMIPIFLTFIIYWTIYGQGQTSYLLQGSYMKLKLSDSFTMPAASLYLFEITVLLILIPVVDRIVYPALRRMGFNFTPLRKIGVGMLFATGSVTVAGVMEIQRKQFLANHGYVTQDPFHNAPVNASQMNIFYQVPQYILQGTGEVLVSIPGLVFAYSQSPVYLRGVLMGLNLAMIGLGFYVAGALAAIVKKATNGVWYPEILNQGSLEYYFFFLAGLMFLNFLLFLLLASRYQYVQSTKDPKLETTEELLSDQSSNVRGRLPTPSPLPV